jgi:hypothetical protein
MEGREQAYLYSIGYFGAHEKRTVTVWAASVLSSFPLVALVALAGLAVRGGVERSVAIPSLVYLASAVGLHLLSFGDPRFHLPFVPVMAVLATGLWRWRQGLAERRAVCLAVSYALMLPAWYGQLRNYLSFLRILSGPDGWQSHVSFDDLL